MTDKKNPCERYEEILRVFFNAREEQAYFDVSELGKELVLTEVGPDVLIDIHNKALKKLIKDIDALAISRLVVSANEVLLNGIMAYAMSYYGFMDQQKEDRRNLVVAQQQAASERDNLDNIVSAIDADLLLLDRDMKILWVNKRLKERSPFVQGELIGALCNKAYCNIEEVPCDCPAKLAFETGKPIRQEHPITHPDGTTRHYYFTCSPLSDSEGNHSRVLELVQDITDRYLQEEELRHKTIEIEEKNAELERFNKIFVNRELRMIELKQRIAELEGKLERL